MSSLEDLAKEYRAAWQQRERAMDAWRQLRESIQREIGHLGQQILDLEHKL